MTRSKKRFLLILLMAVVTLILVVGMNWDDIMREYRFWQDFEFLEVNEQGYKEYLHLKSGIVMVLLPGGEFMMGSPEDELGRKEFEHLHKVRLLPFLIAKYEVSQGLWEKIADQYPRYFPIQHPALPVIEVSWNECFGNENSFCKKVGLSLPTEAQWEYACRAGTNTPYAFGESITSEQVNFSGIHSGTLPPGPKKTSRILRVDSFPSNNFGLHHMHGNVEEWCLDFFNKDFYKTKESYYGEVPPVAGTPYPVDGSIHNVIRGGSCFSSALECRSALRFGRQPEYINSSLGFRPVYNFAP